MNRPDRHNASRRDAHRRARRCVPATVCDARIRVCARRPGPKLSAGADLNWMRRQRLTRSKRTCAMRERFAAMPPTRSIRAQKPTNSRIHGACARRGPARERMRHLDRRRRTPGCRRPKSSSGSPGKNRTVRRCAHSREQTRYVRSDRKETGRRETWRDESEWFTKYVQPTKSRPASRTGAETDAGGRRPQAAAKAFDCSLTPRGGGPRRIRIEETAQCIAICGRQPERRRALPHS